MERQQSHDECVKKFHHQSRELLASYRDCDHWIQGHDKSTISDVEKLVYSIVLISWKTLTLKQAKAVIGSVGCVWGPMVSVKTKRQISDHVQKFWWVEFKGQRVYTDNDT